jgi:cellulose synthase/poly-beta-1,6-N-acetylglucosamine synthase-like glycosyltransferase
MNWNKWIRQFHRWLAITFTVTVIVTFVALAQEDPAVWVSYVPLFPLAFLLITGLYLFVLPHATRWRAGRRTAARQQ